MMTHSPMKMMIKKTPTITRNQRKSTEKNDVKTRSRKAEKEGKGGKANN